MLCLMGHPPVAVQREIEDEFVWSAIPVRVIEDSRDEVVLYRARGTECWWPSHPRHEHPSPSTVTQLPQRWEYGLAGLLTIVEPAAGHSVSLMWGEDWSFLASYVDFIRPYRRTPIGWDFSDLHLDLVIDASGSWRVKDEDEFDAAVSDGRLQLSEADEVRHNCARLIQRLENGESLVRAHWTRWRPDHTWLTPSLSRPRGDRLSAAPTPADDELEPGAWIA